MNTQQPDQKAVAATGDFEGAIQESLTRIQSIYELVPDFQFTPNEGIGTERAAKTVSDEFFEATITSVNSSSQLKDSTALDSDAVRLVSQRNLRFEAVATAAEALARNVRFNMLRERWDVAKEALHVYDVAKSLVRRPRGAALVPHVRAMRKALGRTNPGKRKPAPEPVPAQPPVK
jgi:hypothetical protein